MDLILNVIPARDPVPMFDTQVGMIQNIPCDANQPIACHSITRTLKTLVNMCGI